MSTPDRRRTLALIRGFRMRCPNCGRPTLFEPGRRFRLARTCRACGLPVDRGRGFFLGPVAVNYGLVGFGLISPLVLLGVMEVIPLRAAIGFSLAGAILFPILLYRFSWSLWVGGFYYFLPHLLSAEGRAERDDAEF